jgi:hypothetical protein
VSTTVFAIDVAPTDELVFAIADSDVVVRVDTKTVVRRDVDVSSEGIGEDKDKAAEPRVPVSRLQRTPSPLKVTILSGCLDVWMSRCLVISLSWIK